VESGAAGLEFFGAGMEPEEIAGGGEEVGALELAFEKEGDLGEAFVGGEVFCDVACGEAVEEGEAFAFAQLDAAQVDVAGIAVSGVAEGGFDEGAVVECGA